MDDDDAGSTSGDTEIDTPGDASHGSDRVAAATQTGFLDAAEAIAGDRQFGLGAAGGAAVLSERDSAPPALELPEPVPGAMADAGPQSASDGRNDQVEPVPLIDEPALRRDQLPLDILSRDGRPSGLLRAEWNWAGRPTLDDYVPDLVLDAGRVGDCVLMASSIRGGSHRYDALPRQDSVSVAATSGFLAIAVADGTSSARLSHIGSRVAANLATEQMVGLAEGFDGELDCAALERIAGSQVPIHLAVIARAILCEAPKQVDDGAARPGSSVATTLTCALIPTIGAFPRHALVFRVGDSPAFVLNANGWRQVFETTPDAVASSATDALPIHTDRVVHEVVSIGRDDALVLVSDGVGKPIGDGTGPVGEYLRANLAEPPEHPLSFLSCLNFDMRSFDDDRSAIFVWSRRESS